MIDAWLYAIASVFVVSLISLIGVLTITMQKERLRNILIYMVSFSAGALFGDAFIHLLPEAVSEAGFGFAISAYVLFGIVFSFVAEKLILWRHCHMPITDSHVHSFAYMNLFGDAVHNFIDGLIIGASYLVSVPVGIATTIAVILHEIPQEIGDFGVMLHGGFSNKKALMLNFLTALSAVVGVLVSFLLISSMQGITMFLVPFAAGTFIYIAGSDLIPELHKEVGIRKSMLQLVVFLLGIMVMVSLLVIG